MDVVVIGGGQSGRALAEQCAGAGLQVTVIDLNARASESGIGEWITGKGVVSKPGLVAILDPQTADERRLLQAKAIVFAVGKIDPNNLPGMMMGITKLGATLTPDMRHINCNDRGETGAAGIYAVGGCVQHPTPGIFESLLTFCTTSLAER